VLPAERDRHPPQPAEGRLGRDEPLRNRAAARVGRKLAPTAAAATGIRKANAAKVIQLQRRLAEERETRSRIIEDWREAQAAITTGQVGEKIPAVKDLADPPICMSDRPK
jgi:hypothetical protein